MPSVFVLDSIYSGPYFLNTDTAAALEVLSQHLSIEIIECETHSVLIVKNFEKEEVLEATAVYLVSAIAQNIEANMQIRIALFDETDISRELLRDVVSVIRKHNSDSEFNKMVRNPWLWEGISHMLIHLSRFDPDFHPSGRVLVKTSIKHDVHDHGLDVIAIYESDRLGISAGECKAYFDNPARGIRDASNKLREVDLNTRDIEIRSVANQLRSALDKEAKGKLSGAFWKNERSYLPFICCDEVHACDWTENRETLQRLAIPKSRKFLYPFTLPNAHNKFDAICDIMRCYAAIEE